MAERYSTAELIEKATQIFDGRFSYPGEFRVNKHKQREIKVVCAAHGPFFVPLSRHLRGSDCRKCAYEKNALAAAHSTADFISAAQKKHGNKYDYSESKYVGAQENISIRCPIHGVFTQRAGQHLWGYGCRECAWKENGLACLRDTEGFIRIARSLKEANKYSYDKVAYKTSTEKVCITCLDHKRDFWVTPASFLQPSYLHGCPACIGKTSKPEKEISAYLSSLGIAHVQNDRELLGGVELDIYIPSTSIAIEFQGVFWHGTGALTTKKELSPREASTFLKKQANEKTVLCAAKGVRLVTIWEDEWRGNRQIIEAFLKNLLLPVDKIFARKCSLVIVSKEEAIRFHAAYHIQRSAPSMPVNYGLVYAKKLCAVMSFNTWSSNRGGKTSLNTWELIRFSSNKKVVGGASKLLKKFLREHSPSKIVSYCETRLFSGAVYTKIGFRLDKKLPPDYQVVYNNQRKHKSFASKKNLLRRFPHIDITKTEVDLCAEQGLHRVYNPSLLRFIWVAST